MYKKVYLKKGLKTLAFILSVLSSYQISNAQNCGSIDLGDDVTLCSGNSIGLSPTVDLALEGYADNVNSVTGQVSYANKALGAPDGSGAYFCRGNSGKYTRAIWGLPCDIPAGTKVCIRMRVPSGSAYFKIYGVNDNTVYKLLATKYKSGSSYHDVCVTTSQTFDAIKIVDLGCAPFRVDAIKYTKSCDASYSWSTGDTTQTITVSPTSTTSYVLSASVCGNTVTDTVKVNVTSCGQPTCEKKVRNTVGCANQPYVIWLKDKNGGAHHLKGDTSKYQWIEYTNGNVRFLAEDISASGLNGTFDVDLTFSGRTTSPPTNSPKYSSCFTVGSVNGWTYFTTTSGTITSTHYGTMSVSRQGPAFQMGEDANITQSGFGASGWLAISGGSCFIKSGDINVMLDKDCSTDEEPVCEKTVSNTIGCANKPYVIWLKDKNGGAHHLQGDTTKYQWLEYANGDVKFIAEDISASGLSGTFDVELNFSGRTSTAPTNSPKYSSCFTVGSVSGWEYFTTTTGTIKSTNYGDMTLSRKGPAFQLGDDANITQSGFGASGWFNISGGNGHITTGDVNVMLTEGCNDDTPECKRIVTDGISCNFKKAYVVYLQDSNGSHHHLKGDSTKYQWIETDDKVRFIAKEISAPGLNGTFDVDVTFSGRTTTPPAGSPKQSGCFSIGSATDWEYFPTASGTIKSTHYGDMTVTRRGEAFQLGYNANITSSGFGASGWLTISGGTGGITFGDVNVMLTEECVTTNGECEESHEYDPCLITYAKGAHNNSSTTISISENVAEIDEIIVEGLYKNGQPTAGSFTNGSTTVNWTSADANELDNVSGISNKGYYQATLPAASSVTMNVSNNKDDMHGFVAYVKLKDGYCSDNYTSLSDERYYVYHTTKNTTFGMPETISEKTITAVLPIAEMNNDSRIAKFTLTAGSQSESVTINTYDLGQSMTIRTLTLENVPGGITSATLKIESPSSGGDSYIAGNVSFNWYLPCEVNGDNRIAGTVFFDRDRDTVLNVNEEGQKDVTVYLYNDNNDDGQLNDGELAPIDSIQTGDDGTYEFFVTYGCNKGYINNVTYQSSIDNPSNMLGEPGADYSGFNNNNDNLIVELDATIPDGEEYTLYLGTIESGAYAIISESTDGTNFYHNTNIAILTSGSEAYTITADRDVKYIKFDKNTINTISGYNTNGSTSTNSYDYKIYGLEFCKGVNSYVINTDLDTYPDGTDLTTNNIETAVFTGPNQEDLGNDFGFNGEVFIDGYVFHDLDSNGVRGSGEDGTEDVTISLYIDADCDGVLDSNETTAVETAETNQDGYYSFTRPYEADMSNLPDGLKNCYIVKSDEDDYPDGSVMTTDNIETAEFDSHGQEDLDNDFGWKLQEGAGEFCGKIEVTLNKHKVKGSNDFNNFPVYLDLTHNAFKYRQNWTESYDQGIYSPNGYDIQVTNSHGDVLPIEIVDYDSTSGNIKLWVNVDTLYTYSNTILYVEHGIEFGPRPNPSTPAVWGSQYKAVYHFDDLKDATSNNNDANNYGSSITSGKLSGGLDLDGNDYLRVPYSSSLDIGGKELTMSAWVNIASSPSSDAPFAVKGPSVNEEAYMFGVDGGTNPVKINSRVTTNTGHYRHDAGSLTTGQWVYVQFVYDGDLGSGQKRVYVNGQLEYSASASGNIKQGNHDLFIGKRVYSDNRYLKGKIDELRISSVASSADWVKTEFYNQKYPHYFASITDSFGCGAVPVTWLEFTAKKVGSNDVQLDWATATEVNNSHFEVERSFDGEVFETVGAPINGAGNSNHIENYEAMDYNLPQGAVYYRVKQIDFDGQYDYTPVKVVLIQGREVMTVYPNPAKDEVTVQFEAAKNSNVTITNVAGQVIDQLRMSSEGDLKINTSDYPHGVYFIKVDSKYNTATQKIVVQK